MSSRQPTATEASQAELEEDEVISGTGEGDEIMEEPEEQEDGYSESLCVSRARSYLASSLRTLVKSSCLYWTLFSIIHTNFDTHLDQLVLFFART